MVQRGQIRQVTEQAQQEVSKAQKDVAQYQQDVQKFEKEYNDYLRSDSGKLQYAKEAGLQGTPIYGKLGKGYVNQIMAYKYSTPYGEVIDRSPEYKSRQMEAKVQAKELGFKNAAEMEEAAAWTKQLTGQSGTFVTATGQQVPFTQEGAAKLFSQQVADIQSQLPKGEKLITSNGRITGIESSTFQQSLTPEAYNQRIAQYNAQLSPMVSTSLPAAFTTKFNPQTFAMQSFKPQTFTPVSTYTPAPQRGVIGNIQQGISTAFTRTFGVTPREVGTGIKQIPYSARDVGLGVFTGAETLLNLPSKEMTKQQYQDLTSGKFVKTVQAVRDIGKFQTQKAEQQKKLEQLNKDYDSGKIDAQTYSEKYAEVSKSLPYSISPIAAITSGYGLTPTQQGLGLFGYGVGTILPYIVPQTRIIAGGLNLPGSIKELRQAETPLEKTFASANVAFNVYSLGSGLRNIAKTVIPTANKLVPFTKEPVTKFLGMTVKGTANQMNWLTSARTASALTIAPSLAAVPAVYQYEVSGSKAQALGTFAGLLAAPLIARGLTYQITSRVPKAELYGKSERQFKQFVSSYEKSKTDIAKQVAQSDKAWASLLKTQSQLDKSIAFQNERFGVNIQTPSALKANVKYGPLKTEAIGSRELKALQKTAKLTSGDIISAKTGEDKLVLRGQEARRTAQGITIQQRPNIPGIPKPSQALKESFPDLFREKKVIAYQDTLVYQRGKRFTGLGYTTIEDVKTGKIIKPDEVFVLKGTSKTAIADVLGKGRLSQQKVKIEGGELLVTNVPAGRLKETQVFKLGKPELISKEVLPTGERVEIRKTSVTAGITSQKPIRLTPEQAAKRLISFPTQKEIKALSKFYQTKQGTIEKITYESPKPKLDISVSGEKVKGGIQLEAKVKGSIVEPFKLEGVGGTSYLERKGGPGRTPKPPRPSRASKPFDLGEPKPSTEQVVKGPSTEQVVVEKLVNQDTILDKINVKTDISKVIKTERVAPTQSQYYGKGLYETTRFGTATTGGLVLIPKGEVILGPKIEGALKPKEDLGLDKRLKPIGGVIIKDVIKPMEDINVGRNFKQFDKIAQREQQQFKQELKVKQQLRIQPSISARPTQLLRVTPTPITPKPRQPKLKTELPFPTFEGVKKKRTAERITPTNEKFIAITKRYGKEKVLGIGRTAREAEMIGKRSALETLGATVKVRTTSGRQVQLAEDRLFRKSKTDPLAIVQRQTARLASRGERIEIKAARKGGFNLL